VASRRLLPVQKKNGMIFSSKLQWTAARRDPPFEILRV
jgi:hypothetical protein